MMHWTPQQSAAAQKAEAWFGARDKPFFYIAGYAGTGKTTITNGLIDQLGLKPCYCAYTGKAADVMRRAGCQGAATIHSTIYKFKERNGRLHKSLNTSEKSDFAKADVFVIDECSMVDEETGKDLLSFGKPVIVIGDPGQLPPVRGAGFFTAGEPDVMLTEIHRQAADSPIIDLATKARKGERIEYGAYGNCHVVTKDEFRDGFDITKFDAALVGKRDTRAIYNTRLRELNGFRDPYPMVGDKVICRKNDRFAGVYNGQGGTITDTWDATDEHPNMLGLEVDPDDGGKTKRVMVRSEFFTNQPEPRSHEIKGTQKFEYGYVLTVHLAQGSQWPKVVLFDESWGSPEDRQRWLYTGITRAAEQIVIVR